MGNSLLPFPGHAVDDTNIARVDSISASQIIGSQGHKPTWFDPQDVERGPVAEILCRVLSKRLWFSISRMRTAADVADGTGFHDLSVHTDTVLASVGRASLTMERRGSVQHNFDCRDLDDSIESTRLCKSSTTTTSWDFLLVRVCMYPGSSVPSHPISKRLRL